MQKREKILLFVTLAIAMMFVLGLGVNQYLLKPAADLDRRAAARLTELQELEATRFDAERAVHAMRTLAQRTYANDPDRATATAGARLVALLEQSGLAPSDFTRTPVSPRRLRGGLEVGWSVRGRGALGDVVDLLYLIAAEPVVHRVDGLALAAGDKPGHVNVQFRFLTLVIDAVPPPADREPLEPRRTLADDQRALYAGIVERDLFRPYIKRPPPPEPPPPPQAEERSEPPPDPPPGPETYRVVSLSQWRGQPEVHVWDSTRERTERYVPGDELIDGHIVMVDYRSLPLPTNPSLHSDSRVILEIDSDYWAVERGHTLADKYPLDEERLPATLRSNDNSVAGTPTDQTQEQTPEERP